MKATPPCGTPDNSGADQESPDHLTHYPLARSEIGGFSPQCIFECRVGGWSQAIREAESRPRIETQKSVANLQRLSRL